MINKEKKPYPLSSFKKFIKNIEDTVYRFLLNNTTFEEKEGDIIFKNKDSKDSEEEIIKMQYGGKNDKYFYSFYSLGFLGSSGSFFLDHEDLDFAFNRLPYDEGKELKNFKEYMTKLDQLRKNLIEFNKNKNEYLKKLIVEDLKNNSLRSHESQNKIGDIIQDVKGDEKNKYKISKAIVELNENERSYLKKIIVESEDEELQEKFKKYMQIYINNYKEIKFMKFDNIENNEELKKEFKSLIEQIT